MNTPPLTEPREVIHCSKAIFAAVVAMEQDARHFGIDPAFWLAEFALGQAYDSGCDHCHQFLWEVLQIMKVRECFGSDTLYVLHDEKPAR